ncbi:MAG: response regulator [Thermosynechococcaceae cyanobacterium MS004]|nr:response regulator [Thermosynechococcaceae cyanobacterium MS004]
MKKILVIEDEKSVLLNILKILKFENFDPIGADNGETGVKIAQEQKPDLILCDIMMPDIDGYAVQNALCQDLKTATIPFIFLTAKADRADMRLAMTLGADDYLTKPFSREELLESIFARLDKQAVVQKQFQGKLDQLKGNISTSLPAELFVPLQRIRSFLETLCREEAALAHSTLLPETLLSEAQESHKASLHLEKLLQNFLLYALLEIAIQDPSQAAVFCGKSMTENKTLIAEIAQEKAKEFGREADLELQLQPATLLILEANLAKIVEELLSNAFKFSPQNSPVHVSTSVESGQFLLKVSDEGKGLSVQELDNLGAYVQFGQKLSGKGSAGLGLMIVKRLTELHGGLFEIDSELSKRTVVQIVLPIAH